MLIFTLYCLFIGVKLPCYPTAPKKLQPVQDTNMLHNACEYWWQLIKHVNVLRKHNMIVTGWFMCFTRWRWSLDCPSGVCRQFWGQWNVHSSWVFTSPLAPIIPLHKVKVHSGRVVSHCLLWLKYSQHCSYRLFHVFQTLEIEPRLTQCSLLASLGQGDDHSTWVYLHFQFHQPSHCRNKVWEGWGWQLGSSANHVIQGKWNYWSGISLSHMRI